MSVLNSESILCEESLALVLLSTWSPNSLLRSSGSFVGEKVVSCPVLVYTELKELKCVHKEAVKSASVYFENFESYNTGSVKKLPRFLKNWKKNISEKIHVKTNFVKIFNFFLLAQKSFQSCLEVILKLSEAKILFENVKRTNSFQNNQKVPSWGNVHTVTERGTFFWILKKNFIQKNIWKVFLQQFCSKIT